MSQPGISNSFKFGLRKKRENSIGLTMATKKQTFGPRFIVHRRSPGFLIHRRSFSAANDDSKSRPLHSHNTENEFEENEINFKRFLDDVKVPGKGPFYSKKAKRDYGSFMNFLRKNFSSKSLDKLLPAHLAINRPKRLAKGGMV